MADKAGRQTPSSSSGASSASKIASLKMSDEITIIPQGKATLTPASAKTSTSITPSKSSEQNVSNSANKYFLSASRFKMHSTLDTVGISIAETSE